MFTLVIRYALTFYSPFTFPTVMFTTRIMSVKLSYLVSQKAPVGHLSLKELMPATDGYMTYEGSTTHPGCWETTVWVIVNKPIYMSAQELYALRRLMQGTKETPKAPLGNNRRPIQLLHHRTIRTNIDFRKAPDAKCPSMVPTTHYRDEFFFAANTWTDGTISRNSL
ncbi:hypothetical protein KQX54_019176 [Cotesia glomerata]|uniref:Alpha-carbonic anhydrase domain-containing protein n=1 Tax=Cotesia glomerata TaxID=32391 RepID=A0AAV7I6P6_COTGL|nr:hypothetical protein KQX54_019176 [Cotesia glomerata]